MNQKFVSKSNFVLRKVLNSENSLDILQDFIETFLNLKIKEIKLNPYLKIKSNYLPSEENFGIADVRIKTYDDKVLNVGIQFIDGIYVQNKLLLYYAQIHANQLEYDENRKLAKTITINLLDFKYFSSKEYHKKILIKAGELDKSLCENLELHVIELPKFKINVENNLSKKDYWMSYLVGSDNVLIEKALNANDKIKKLNKLLEQYWKSEKME